MAHAGKSTLKDLGGNWGHHGDVEREVAEPQPPDRHVPRRELLGSRYVGNILEMLRLHPSILEAIERPPVGAGNAVTERWLRPSLGCRITSS